MYKSDDPGGVELRLECLVFPTLYSVLCTCGINFMLYAGVGPAGGS